MKHNPNPDEIYKRFKFQPDAIYDEEKHCKMLIKCMLDNDRGTIGSFCVEAMICDRTFYKWVSDHPVFKGVYYYSKQLARENWEEEGRRLRDADFPMGTVNYSYEYWKMMGWTRFGISKTSRIKLNLDKDKTKPTDLYDKILEQAREGDFTASEFKQLMESVNVGLNVHQHFELQKQIDDIKSAQAIMEQNTNVKNPFTDKGTS